MKDASHSRVSRPLQSVLKSSKNTSDKTSNKGVTFTTPKTTDAPITSETDNLTDDEATSSGSVFNSVITQVKQ